MWNDFLSLIYPRICPGCNEGLMKNEKCICTTCLTVLYKTEYYKYHANPVSKMLWGMVEFDSAMALYSYRKESVIQKLIFALKYNNQPVIGEFLGVELGKELLKSPKHKDLDMIIPVPIHKKKERKRGYNQSLYIARGVATVLKLPICNELLVSNTYKTSQTSKKRYKRWLNNHNTYLKSNATKILENKHVLIVDDVITTGSTIENCVSTLNEVQGIKCSIATLAMS